MSQLERARQLLRWIPTVPRQMRETQQSAASAEAILAQLRDTVEASAKAELEALRLLTRSINELNARLAKLLESEDTASRR